MKTKYKIERLIRSLRLFEEKKKKADYLFCNDDLHPVLKKQLDSIISQVRNIDK
jgi:hypothetical protein